jgi:hypothetical protein
MLRTKLLATSLVAGLLWVVQARADDCNAAHSAPSDGSESVLEGIDAKGRTIRVSIVGVKVETLQRVPPANAKRYPDSHWTARIGAGDAASHEH